MPLNQNLISYYHAEVALYFYVSAYELLFSLDRMLLSGTQCISTKHNLWGVIQQLSALPSSPYFSICNYEYVTCSITRCDCQRISSVNVLDCTD